MKKIMRNIIYAALIFTSWISIHYFAVHIYVHVCVPIGVSGYFVSMALIPSPHCILLQWAMYETSNYIYGLCVLFGSWMLSHIFIQ